MVLLDEIKQILSRNDLFLLYEFIDLARHFNHPALTGSNKSCEIGSTADYSIKISKGMKSISRCPQPLRVSLEDVVVNGQELDPNIDQRLVYEINLTNIIDENGKVKIEGLLYKRTDFACRNLGPDFTGESFSGYVKEIISRGS